MSVTAALLMAFDVGRERIGIAIGNTLIRHAEALCVIAAAANRERFKQIDTLVDTWHPQAFVVGVPFHLDGADHPFAVHCRRFGQRLQGRYARPVHWIDERYSSVAAHDAGHRAALDAHAAAVILQQHFDTVPS